MFSFGNPNALYLLLLIPLVLAIFVLARRTRQKKLKQYGNIEVLRTLMPDVSAYKPWIKISVMMFALLIIVIMIARPRAGSKEETVKVRGIEVMVALDVSNSMLASSSDSPSGVSRLQKSKLMLEKLINKLGDDKVGLIVFAGNAYTQLPITSDFISAKMFLSSISTEMVPTQGTAIGAAIKLAMNSFTPNENSQKAIIIITDGENHEDDAIGMAKDAQEKGIQVNVIGIGSPKGAPIPLGRPGEFLKDDNGQVVTTYLNEQMAQDIAKAGKGTYVSASDNDAVDVVDDQLKTLAKSDIEKTVYSKHYEQFPIFAWIALVVLIVEIFILDRKISWLKDINFFSKNEQNK